MSDLQPLSLQGERTRRNIVKVGPIRPATGNNVAIAQSTTSVGRTPGIAGDPASATVVATASANQTPKIGGTDTGSMTAITSGGLALSLSNATFTHARSPTTITSAGLTKGNTLLLSGTVRDPKSVVRVYDGATLLGTATFSVEDPRSWGFVTAVLADGSHSFTVSATDNAGHTATMSAVTATVDATPPRVISVSSRVSGSVKTGKFVQITLKMSEKVAVSGTPGLLLNDGGTATYASGSGTDTLTFKYAAPSVQATSDLGLIGDTLPSPTAIQDLAGNAADLSALRADLGSTTTVPTTSTTLTGTQRIELFGPSSANVTFASGATGTLILDASSQFTGTVAGLNSAAPFDTIDLADIAFGSNTTVVYSASSADTGTLTVSDGAHTAKIALLGQYSPTSFKIASDGHGGTAVVDPLLNTSGSWSGVLSWPLIGIQSLLLPDGKILSYGTDQAGLQGAYKIYDVWDPVTNTHNTLPNKTFTDEFCGAAEIIPQTGDVILTGGDARPLGSVSNGVPDTNIFDYRTDSLTPNPSGPMAFGRWYPTLITLDTGQLLILGGRDGGGAGVGYPEIFTSGVGWRTLTGAYIAEIANGVGWFYPRAWEASDGKVIAVAAGGGTVYAIDPSGNGQVSVVGHAPVSLYWNEPAIMFAPDRCLILGSNGSVWVMDISGPTPVFTQTGGLAPDRIWSNLTVLPDGRVMVSGGSAVDSNTNPSLSVTDADNTVAIWDPSTGLWTSTGASAAVPRLYHSTALLLPDGTILSLGGGGLQPNQTSMNHLNGEIYTPGYLFDANGAPAVRPVIQQAPLDLSPGQTFTVRVDNPANIRTLALMPFGSTTHSFNTTARRIELPFSVQADGSLSITLPANSDVVTPGDWMLFAIGNNGTPSVASTVQINPYPDATPPTETVSTTITTDTGATATIASGGVTKDNTLGLSGAVSDAGGVSSVQVYDGATLLGAATVSSGNWSYVTPALVDGSHSFTAKATDNAGNTTTTSAVTATINTGQVDTTPPTETVSTTITTDTGATITIASGGVTKDNTLGLSGAVSDAGGVSSVQVYDGATLLGAATVSAGNWSYTTPALVDGGHSFTAKATDNAGNATTTSAVTATVDTKPPTERVSTVAFSADTGTSSSDFITKTASQTISGTLSAALASGDVIRVSLNNGATWQTATATTGSTTFSLGGVTLTGSNTLQVRAEDTAGNFSTAKAQTYVLDTTPPTETISTTITTDTGATATIASGGVTKDNTLGLSGAVSDAGGVSSVQVYDGATLLGAATVSAGNWSYTTPALVDGGHSFTAKATDNAGNATTTSAVTATVDTKPPTERVSTVAFSADTGTSSSDFITKTASQTISGTLSAALASGDVIRVSLNNGATWQTATATTGSTTFSLGGVTLTGSNTLQVRAEDTAGNFSTAKAQTYVLDTTPPTETVSTTITTDTGATATIASGGVTKDNTLGLSGAVSDAGGVSSVQVYDGATLLGPATINSGNWSYMTPALLDGSHSFTAKATDNAGNATTTSVVTATVDTKPPTERVSTVAFSADTGTSSSDFITKTASQTISGTLSAALASGDVIRVSLNNGATWQTATATTGSTTFSLGGVTLTGSNTLQVRAEDTAGNFSTAKAQTYVLDTTPPTETVSTTITTDTGATATIASGGVTKDNTLGLSGAVSDAGGVSSVQVYDGATLLGPATVSSGNWSYMTPALLDGSHSFTAKATDNAGNTTTTSAVTATVDALAPTLTGIVASPATADLNVGKTATLTANFSEVVTVGSGTPALNLNDGGTATYVSGLGSSALNYTYTITAGQNTSDLQVTGFQGATIQDGAGNIANLSGVTATNPVNPTGTLQIDTTPPLVTSVVASPRQGTVSTGQTVKINLNTSEKVTVATSAGKPTLLLNDGGTATYASGSGTNSLVFNYKVPGGQGTPDLQVIGIALPSSGAIQDLAGNNASLLGAAADLKLQIGKVTTQATKATISSTQTLELFGPSAENITFAAGSTGTLLLDSSAGFTGQITGFTGSGTGTPSTSDKLDLRHVNFSSPNFSKSYANNVLTVTDGTTTAKINMVGSYTLASFHFATDGSGGTLVTDPPSVTEKSPSSKTPTTIVDSAANVATLTAAQIASLSSTLHVSAVETSDTTLALTTAQAVAFTSAHIALSAPAGSTVEVSDTAAHLQALTAAQITALPGIGVSELLSTNANVSYSVAQTAAILSSGLTVAAAGPNTVTETFANGDYSVFENGALITQKSVKADGSYDIACFDVFGLGYSSYEDIYSASGARVAEAQDLTDGSGTLLLYGNGLTINSGPKQLSVAAGGDIFALNPHANETITASGHNSEVFAYEAGFARSTITGFRATGASHDMLQFQTSTFSDAMAVLNNASLGANVEITDALGDTLTLNKVTKAALVANQSDFRFT